MPSVAEVRLCQCFWRKSLFIYSCWQRLLFATRVTRDLLLQALPIKFHLVPDTPKTSATFSVKKATICAEFFGTFYRHRKYIKNITKLRECQIISTENFIARQIIHGKQTCIMPSAAACCRGIKLLLIRRSRLALFARLRRFCVRPNKWCCACYTGATSYGWYVLL